MSERGKECERRKEKDASMRTEREGKTSKKKKKERKEEKRLITPSAEIHEGWMSTFTFTCCRSLFLKNLLEKISLKMSHCEIFNGPF